MVPFERMPIAKAHSNCVPSGLAAIARSNARSRLPSFFSRSAASVSVIGRHDWEQDLAALFVHNVRTANHFDPEIFWFEFGSAKAIVIELDVALFPQGQVAVDFVKSGTAAIRDKLVFARVFCRVEGDKHALRAWE